MTDAINSSMRNKAAREKIAPDDLVVKSVISTPSAFGDRTFKFVISTSDVDTMYDVIDQTGWELTDFKANPVVLFGHDSNALPVGRCTEIGLEGGKLKATVEFAPASCNPLAEQVFQCVKQGFLNATSVGFNVLVMQPPAEEERREQYGIDYKRQILREFSIVPVPANQYALIEPGQREEAELSPSILNTNDKKASPSKRSQEMLKLLQRRGDDR